MTQVYQILVGCAAAAALILVLVYSQNNFGHSLSRMHAPLLINSEKSLNMSPELNRSLIEFYGSLMNQSQLGDVTIVTIVDYESRESAIKWITSLRRVQIKKYLVFCVDERTKAFLNRKEFNTSVYKLPAEWLAANPNRLKAHIWHQLLSMGHSFIYSDPQVVWLSAHVLDHLDNQYRNSPADVLFAAGLSEREVLCSTGFFYARSTDFVRSLFHKINHEIKTSPRINDRTALRRILYSSRFNDCRVDTLDLLLYPNKPVFVDLNLNNKTKIKPLIADLSRVKVERHKSRPFVEQDLTFNATFNEKFKSTDKTESELAEVMNRNKLDSVNMVTVSNYGFRNFTLNWIISLKRHGYSKFVVFSFDHQLIEFLAKKGYRKQVVLVPPEWLDYNISANMSGYMQGDYINLCKSKVNIVYGLLTRNYSVLYSDTDVVFLSPHVLTHILFQYANSFAELLYMQDTEGRTKVHNGGFFWATPTRFVIRLLQRLIEAQRLDKAMHDQGIMQYMLGGSSFNDSRVDTLDSMLYVNGKDHFNLKLNDKFSIAPLVVHVTYTLYPEEKMSKLRDRNYWFSDEF
jgi:hypothetical protein